MNEQLLHKIYINARFLTQPVTGVQRFSIELVKALDTLIENGTIDKSIFSFTLLLPKSQGNNLNLKHIKLKTVGYLKGHLWEQIELPIFSKDGLLISLGNTGPIFKFNHWVTIHDASVYAIPDAYSFLFRTWYKFIFKSLSLNSKKILTVSNFSKKEIIKYIGATQDKIEVLYEGKEHILSINSDNTILKKHHLLGKRYILVVSSMSPHKNFANTLLAIEELKNSDIETVIVGINYPKVFMPPELQLSEKVRHLGYVSDGELKALYENAFCFIHPTLYEGFGLPPLEAMSCACPVILSRIDSLNEIFGNAALYFDPNNPKDIAKKVKSILNNHELHNDLKIKCLEHSQNFSWPKCAQETYKILEKSLKHDTA